ncbi:MAG: hypothetical protein CO021_01585 [Deltaproteobacteria bacterium CG_4_9_14_0_2_um_filter_42_21]|nr:MAG: hypothetical protein CO021_01585 [Deltaproteobacteria bacterium CG_4_9_14_0_2_um_filter_42_21]
MSVNKISDTAFMISWIRSGQPTLSGDPWASVWNTRRAAQIGSGYLEAMGSLNGRACCLRNRYIAERLLTFEQAHPRMSLLNIAAGFSMYPFRLKPTNSTVDLDFPHVNAFKKETIEKLQAAGELPKRKIEFLSLDLQTDDAIQELRNTIQKQTKYGPMFIILEGILYYLDLAVVRLLFQALAEELPAESQVIAVAWSPKIKHTAKMETARTFFAQDIQRADNHYTYLAPSFFTNLDSLKCTEQLGYRDIEKEFCNEQLLAEGTFLDESFYLLKKGVK